MTLEGGCYQSVRARPSGRALSVKGLGPMMVCKTFPGTFSWRIGLGMGDLLETTSHPGLVAQDIEENLPSRRPGVKSLGAKLWGEPLKELTASVS